MFEITKTVHHLKICQIFPPSQNVHTPQQLPFPPHILKYLLPTALNLNQLEGWDWEDILAKTQEFGILTSICFTLFLPSIPLEVSGKEMNRKSHAPTHFYLSFCYQFQSSLWTRLVHMEGSPRLRPGITWLSFAVFPLLWLCSNLSQWWRKASMATYEIKLSQWKHSAQKPT